MTHTSIKDVNLTKSWDEVILWANEVTNSWFTNMFLISIYIIIAMGIYRYKNDLLEGLAISGFVTLLIAILFWIGGFISGVTLIIVFVYVIISVGILFFVRKRAV